MKKKSKKNKYMRVFKRRALTVFLAFLMFTLVSCTESEKTATIILSGSTSVQPYAEILSERFESIYPYIQIEIQGGGSSAGIEAARSKTADIGMSSRHLKENEKDLWSIEIARDGLAVIVNPNNPITDLSLEDILKIYSGEIKNWNEVGGNNAKIHVITREEGSGTRAAFEELVMEEGIYISAKAIVQDSNGTVRQLVSGDINAIGYISLGLVNETVKSISLNGVEAVYENIVNKTYTLARPFLFVATVEPTGNVMDFINFVMSYEGQEMLKDEGLIPTVREINNES